MSDTGNSLMPPGLPDRRTPLGGCAESCGVAGGDSPGAQDGPAKGSVLRTCQVYCSPVADAVKKYKYQSSAS